MFVATLCDSFEQIYSQEMISTFWPLVTMISGQGYTKSDWSLKYVLTIQ